MKVNTYLSSLVDASLILRGRVVRVQKIGDIRLAEAVVEVPFKAVCVGQRVTYLASSTWTCDTCHAVVGETVLLFLQRLDISDASKALRNVVRQRKGQTVYEIMHSGSGRMPVVRKAGGDYLRVERADWIKDSKTLCTDDLVVLPLTIRPVKGLRLDLRMDNGYSLPYQGVRLTDVEAEVRRLMEKNKPSRPSLTTT